MSQPMNRAALSPAQESLIEQASTHFDAEEYDKARILVDEVLASAPQDYSALQLAGMVATSQNRLPEASELLKLAMNQAPDAQRTAFSWFALGKALRKAGDLRQAEEAYRRAIRLYPHNCSYVLELADTYMAGWKMDLALETVKAAASRFFNDPTPCAALGNILHKCGRYEDARIAYELAITRLPEYAGAHMSLGSTLKVLGRFEEAEAAMREGLRLDPMLRGYTELVSISKCTEGSPEFETIKKRLDPEMKVPLTARVDSLFALAKIYDDKGDYATSFKYLDEGCRLYRPSLVGTMVGNSIAEHEEMVNGISALFTPDFIAHYEHMSTSELAPIFIIGMPRSGTTLTEQIIASHSLVRPGNELSFMTIISRETGQIWEDRGVNAPGDDATVANDLNQAAARYGKLTEDLWKGSPHITDKMPMNFFYVGMIHFMFPKAKIVYCRRNPVATCFSCLQNLFAHGNLQFSYDQIELGREYRLHERMIAHWNKVLPGRLLTVQYEELVQDNENQVKRILDFCGLQFEPACLESHNLKRAVPTASFAQVRKPIYTSSLDYWKNYEAYLGPLIETLGLKPSQGVPT
jgi:tetratricopeptide (TPR) repeat protein